MVQSWSDIVQPLRIDTDAMLNALPVGMIYVDLEGHARFVNDHLLEMMGLDGHELSTTDIRDFLKGVRLQKDIDNKLKDRAEGYSEVYESDIQTFNGKLIWIRVYASPIKDSEGKVVGSMALVTDVTDQKLAEDLLKESELRFRNLADTSPVLIWMADSDNSYYYFNKTWLDFTGRKLDEEIDSGWLAGVHPDDRERLKEQLDSSFEKREAFSLEYRIMRNDGEYRWMLGIGSPRYLLSGQFAGYIGSCIDISELIDAREELTKQKVELQRSNEELEQFAYVASHDLQEPLRMVSSYVQLIQKRLEGGKPEELNELMDFAVDGVKRMQNLINDLLEYSRVNRLGKAFEPTDMNRLLKVVQHNLMKLVEEVDAEIVIDDLPTISADSTQMVQLFQNLMENSLKFKGEEKPRVEISCKEKQDVYEFCIKDNGIGIDPKYFERIFVIFQRLHSRKDYKGTGIGLALCRKIIERHGGEIWLDSNPGDGTTFYFTLQK